jgi:hypothetical protein
MTAVLTSVPAEAERGTLWLTDAQEELDVLATSLMEHPEVEAARAAAVAECRSYPEFETENGPATLTMAIDNLMFGCMHFAVNDNPGDPKLIWTARLPYTIDGRRIHDSRYGGDTADRVYRVIGVSPDCRYEITGRRHPTHPSVDDFSFEAVPPPGFWGQPLAALQSPAHIDVAENGSFTIIADSTPADGRRNHLHMPPGTRTVIVRDTIAEWEKQLPNEVAVRLLDGTPPPPKTRDEIAAEVVTMFQGCLGMAEKMFSNTLRTKPMNDLSPFVRPVQWGVAGGMIAMNYFELTDDQALVMTLDLISARFLTVAAHDPWLTSVPYDTRCSTLNNLQGQPNVDGTYTFVLSPKDPGVHNWIDTGGLRTGGVLARWEGFAEPPQPTEGAAATDGHEPDPWEARALVSGAVRDVRVVALADVPSAIPGGQELVGPEQRQRMVAARAAAYQVRVTGQPVTGSVETHDR